MSKKIDGQARGKYTMEFKLEAVRLVKAGQAASAAYFSDRGRLFIVIVDGISS